jgi:hypothetical protein
MIKVFMKKMFRGILSTVLICCTSTVFAADKEVLTQEEVRGSSVDSWIASGQELFGPSWSKNPKKFDILPSPSPLLYQFTANYSYSGQDGNVVTEKHKASAELILRKQLITSVSRYGISTNETETALTGASINVEAENFFQAVRYPLSDWIQLVGGGAWKINDTAKYIDNRSNYFFGALFDAVDRPDIALTLGFFYGYSDVAYMNSKLTGVPKYADFTPVDDYSSDDVYLQQALRWNITDIITFTEQAEFVQLLKDTEYYFWTVDLGLEFKMAKHLSLTASYTMEYDYSSFTDAVQNYLDERRVSGKPTGEMHELDTALSVGIKVSF